MMILEQLTELTIVNVLDRGIPNKESIVIAVNSPINIAQYGIMLGSYASNGMATPIRDKFFWFGESLLESGDWIFVYTGSGEVRKIPTSDGAHSIYSLYWSRAETVLHDSNIVPILFKMSALQVHPAVQALPQN